jgi:ABC-type nitrate/sulfonate/bicarbonate transport system permease component
MKRRDFDLRGAVLPLLLLLAAESGMRAADTHSDALARPSEVALALWEALGDGSLWQASVQTLGAAGAGLLIGCGAGLLVGLWFGLSRMAGRCGALTVELLKPIPSVAVIPLAMLIFGLGYRMEIMVVAFTCFFPMLMLAQGAVANIEPRMLEMATAIGMPHRDQVWKIVLPAALPRIYVALRLAVGIALVVAVTVEITANPSGLGYGLMIAQQSLRPDLMFAFMIWIGVLGWGLNALMASLQQRYLQPYMQGVPT